MDFTKLVVFQIYYKNKIYTIHIGTDIYKFNQSMNNKLYQSMNNQLDQSKGNQLNQHINKK